MLDHEYDDDDRVGVPVCGVCLHGEDRHGPNAGPSAWPCVDCHDCHSTRRSLGYRERPIAERED